MNVLAKNMLRKGLLLAGLVVCVSAMACTGQAFAAMPWWHVNTISAPATQAGGESTLIVEVSDLGDMFVDGNEHAISIVDKLPAGITPLNVYSGGGGPLAEEIGKSMECAIEAQTVSCTYGLFLLAYERLIVVIGVKVTPGSGSGVSEVDVSGGGAPPVVSRRALELGEAPPAYGAENYEVTPEEEGGVPDTQAGSHPFQLTTTLTFNTKTEPVAVEGFGSVGEGEILPEVKPIELTKDLRFDLPPGLVGNPAPLPKCSIYVFLHNEAKDCPNDTVIGVSTSILKKAAQTSHIPYAVTKPLYSLEPAVGEPARFGFQTAAGPVILNTSVRTGGDYGVIVTVPDINAGAYFIGTQVTFWGVPADAPHASQRGTCLDTFTFAGGGLAEPECPVQETVKPFVIMPTSCTGPLRTTVEGDSWEHIGQYSPPKEYTSQYPSGEPYGLDGCNRLNFEPSIIVAPDGQAASTPTGVSVDEHIPQDASLNPGGLAESSVKDTLVTLPAGVGINPAGGDGLSACSQAAVALESSEEQTCPESAKIGTVEVKTPLLPNPLSGAAYLAEQNANPFGSLVAMYIVVYDPVSGVRIKVAGEVKPDPVTGQLVATFDNTPQLPFEDLVLHFFGGSRAPLDTPVLCGSYTTIALIAPWSGNPPVGSDSTFEINSGPNHTPCNSPLPFKPELTTGSLNIQAGAFTPFTMTMSREDGNQNLSSIELRLPPGLSGTLSNVKLCPEPQADEGICPEDSLIGETTVSVGVGGNPFTVKGGKVYITGSYKGAPFGLSIVNPAKAGPFDLEDTPTHKPACDCLVVRAKIEVNPITAALTITSNPPGSEYSIPTIIEGIPLQIKHVNVTINHLEDFTFNPTNCNSMAITGTLLSTEDSADQLSEPFQVTDCAALGFKPQFAVATEGKTSRADGASLTAKLSYPNVGGHSVLATGLANIAKVKVELPKQLPSRLSTLQKACTESTFKSNPANCPAASRIGFAKATTPLLPGDLEGPAYFVSNGSAKFPELIVVLTGYQGVTVDLHGETFISKTGITSSTFSTVPDVPVGTFELTLPEGPDSALAANGQLCGSKPVMPTEFLAQDGDVIHQSTPITVTDCKKTIKVVKHKKKAKGKKASITVTVPAAGKLTASAAGLSSASIHAGKAGEVTVTLALTSQEQRMLARHHGDQLAAHIQLHFTSKSGQRLSGSTMVLVG